LTFDGKKQRLSARQRGYTSAWDKARSAFLAQPENQFCCKCQEHGLLNPGTMRMDGSLQTNRRRLHLVVDHIIPHKGDQRLFWDRSNWQPLCPDHHDIVKQREEQGRETGPVDINGRPVGDHPWNRRS
jgi:5-methylcytosine-specific restriction protein A